MLANVASIVLFVLFVLFVLLTACSVSRDNVLSVLSYQIVVDVGSTGSRAYVYQIDQSTRLPAITNLFQVANKIPLASFTANPQDAGPTAIQPLLNSAVSFLNNNYGISPDQVATSVLGTAGMRMIPITSQTRIYQSVMNSIHAENLTPDTIETISGQNEGLFAWLNINYLQNNFSNSSDTNGIIEVGGASTQVAFASTNAAPQTIHVNINGNTYYVYSKSYLGLGQDQARAQMDAAPNYNQCYPLGYNTSTIMGDFNFAGCSGNFDEVTSSPSYIGLTTINSVSAFYNQRFVGLGAIYFALNFWSITGQPDQALLEQHINNTCDQNYAELNVLYPNSFQLYNQCSNATYINELLYDDLALGTGQLISLNQINGMPLNYTLGYVLSSTINFF